jgi:hypothetical protein
LKLQRKYLEKEGKTLISEASWKLVDERACVYKKVIETRSKRRKVHIKEQYRARDREVKKQTLQDKRQWINDIPR